jgi:hypothetical protein
MSVWVTERSAPIDAGPKVSEIAGRAPAFSLVGGSRTGAITGAGIAGMA